MAEGGGEGQGANDKFRMEFASHLAPHSLTADIRHAFGGNLVGDSGQLTVITMCHRTENCMRRWNDEVAEEREKLANILIAAADEVCMDLQESNEWADFVNPKTGRAYYGSGMRFRMIQSDDHYLQLGFLQHEVGPCKIIEHPDWGTNVYVTAIFTSAPHENTALLATLKRVQGKFKM